MTFEIPCPSCGTPHSLSESEIPPEGARLPCSACGEPIEVGLVPSPVRVPPSAAQAPKSPPKAEEPDARVVCPRCGLHFVPDEHLAASTSRPVVLMVEDMDFFLDTAREVLGGSCELRFASTVSEGLDALSRGGIDLLLLDLSLANGEDGRDLLRALRGKPCPIVAMTAQDESEIQGEPWAELQRLGVDDILRKGMHMGESLARKIGARLGREPAES